MMKLLIIFVVLGAHMLGSRGSHWSYDGPLGPDHWCELPDEGNQCCGDRQSPINIDSADAVPAAYRLDFHGLDTDWAEMTLTNNGHTVVLTVAASTKDLPSVVLDHWLHDRSDTYIFDSLHFHFGGNDSVGSEHLINEKRYSMEMHVIFYNENYGSFDNAKMYSDGLIVIGVFFTISGHNWRLDPLVDAVSKVTYVNQVATIKPGFPLSHLLPQNVEDSFAYEGSLTTPLCNEAVTWFVLQDKMTISENQISEYRNLLTVTTTGEYVADADGMVNVDEDIYMYNNFRPDQPLNGRTVYSRI